MLAMQKIAKLDAKTCRNYYTNFQSTDITPMASHNIKRYLY